MPIKTYNPVTPGQRGKTGYTFDELTSKKPYKKLLVSLKKSGGRNNYGRITIRFRGGGHKRKYRIIDFKRNKLDVSGTIETIEYDPNRTTRIALVKYSDGERMYILAPSGIKVGDNIISTDGESEILPGNSILLKNIPVGTIIHNIEFQKGNSKKVEAGKLPEQQALP
jgi:large subunit ribosomal protein L2